MSLTKVSYSMIQGEIVNAFDFMTPAQIADVTNKTQLLDVTSSIQAALNTGKNVYFPAGVYMYTGGISQNAQGQHVYGAGIQLLPQPTFPIGNATIFKKISGTAIGWELGSHNGGLHYMSFDNSGFGGNALKVTGHYLIVENICMSNVGGTSYAMYLDSVNTSYFSTINFQENNYACINTNPADPILYTEFHKVICAGITGPLYAIDLTGAINLSFYDCVSEGPILIGDNCQNINFYSFVSENYINIGVPLINILGTAFGGTSPTNINIYSAKITTGIAKPVEVILVKNSKNVSVMNVEWLDLVSTTPTLLYLDGVQGFTLENIACYVANTSYVINSSAVAGSQSVVNISNVLQINSAQILDMKFLATETLNILNSSANVAFYGSGLANSRFTFTNVTGTINTDLLAATIYVECNNCTSVDDVTEIATLNSSVLTNGVFVQSGRIRQISVVLSASPTASWVTSVVSGTVVKALHTLNQTAITGAAGFTGYSVGYTSTSGNNVTAFGTNLSPANSAKNGIFDYGITSAYYNQDNANRDILLTAVGNNFATGTIKLCMVYEQLVNGLT